ncbi:hypothetical protein PR001_g7640 [Phytophthora rubi]|uniref:Uncharacterized protein n=1 Tax=Phytophthora rubi TaxID=129364 RepID=A0A6A3N101_9STRA|nr:hypothetical protein PR001_g7640 [Phytophthora rubi]
MHHQAGMQILLGSAFGAALVTLRNQTTMKNVLRVGTVGSHTTRRWSRWFDEFAHTVPANERAGGNEGSYISFNLLPLDLPPSCKKDAQSPLWTRPLRSLTSDSAFKTTGPCCFYGADHYLSYRGQQLVDHKKICLG